MNCNLDFSKVNLSKYSCDLLACHWPDLTSVIITWRLPISTYDESVTEVGAVALTADYLRRFLNSRDMKAEVAVPFDCKVTHEWEYLDVCVAIERPNFGSVVRLMEACHKKLLAFVEVNHSMDTLQQSGTTEFDRASCFLAAKLFGRTDRLGWPLLGTQASRSSVATEVILRCLHQICQPAAISVVAHQPGPLVEAFLRLVEEGNAWKSSYTLVPSDGTSSWMEGTRRRSTDEQRLFARSDVCGLTWPIGGRGEGVARTLEVGLAGTADSPLPRLVRRELATSYGVRARVVNHPAITLLELVCGLDGISPAQLREGARHAIEDWHSRVTPQDIRALAALRMTKIRAAAADPRYVARILMEFRSAIPYHTQPVPVVDFWDVIVSVDHSEVLAMASDLVNVTPVGVSIKQDESRLGTRNSQRLRYPSNLIVEII